MIYYEFINSIIESRGQWTIPECGVWENHHILPKCLGGEPEKYNHNSKHENLIWLSPYEHWMAHKLLLDEYPDNESLNYAFWRLSTDGARKLSADEYEESRLIYISNLNHEHLSELAKIRMDSLSDEELKIRSAKTTETWKNKSKSEIEDIVNRRRNTLNNKSDDEKELEHINRSNSHKNLNCMGGFYNKVDGEWIKKSDDEIKEIGNKISNSLKNRSEEDKLQSISKFKKTMSMKSDEEIESMYMKSSLKRTGVKRGPYNYSVEGKEKLIESGKNKSGENNGMFGKHHSDETKEKIRSKALGRRSSQAVIVYCVELRRYFSSIAEVCSKLKIDKTKLRMVLNHEINDYKGMHFVKYNEV